MADSRFAAVFMILLAMSLRSFAADAPSQEGLLVVWHFDVGQADCTLLRSPTGKSILIDCGDANWNSSREVRRVAPRIAELIGGTSLDYVVLTHLNVDHVGYVGHGGLWGLFETFGFEAKHIMVRDYMTYPGDLASKGYTLWATYLRQLATSCDVRFPCLGAAIDLEDGVTLTVCSIDGNGLVSPNLTSTWCPVTENELSLGVLISYGAFQEWIGGDLGGTSTQRWFGGDCEAYLDIETSACRLIGDVDVLRVNHHGSAYSTNATFLANTAPEVAIISVGETRAYGHPALSVLERLAAACDVYITTRGNSDGPMATSMFDAARYPNVHVDVGDVVLATDGASYWVNGTQYSVDVPDRVDADGDGYFLEADPDDSSADVVPVPQMAD